MLDRLLRERSGTDHQVVLGTVPVRYRAHRLAIGRKGSQGGPATKCLPDLARGNVKQAELAVVATEQQATVAGKYQGRRVHTGPAGARADDGDAVPRLAEDFPAAGHFPDPEGGAAERRHKLAVGRGGDGGRKGKAQEGAVELQARCADAEQRPGRASRERKRPENSVAYAPGSPLCWAFMIVLGDLRQPAEQIVQVRGIALPARHGAIVERLADLGDAGGAHRPGRLVKGEARRLPFQAAPVE